MDEINSINDRLNNIEIGVNIFFILINCIIIFLMQSGFAFLEAGSVRAKNTTHILIKNILDTAMACFIYWAVGYAFTAGSESNAFIGTNRFFLINSNGSVYADFFYNLVYATASGTIVSGALAERSVIWGYLIYSMVMTGFIYPVVAHWIFSPAGWLNEIGFHDKSGSCVIHVVGGVASFVGAAILGARIGRFGKGGKVNSIPGHSTVLSTLGFFILWFGFLSFNGVSEKGIVGEDFDYNVPPRAVVNTVLGGTGGLLSSILITKIGLSKMEIKLFKKEFKVLNVFGGYWSVGASINGSLAGSVAVCAGCDVLEPWAGFVVGLIAGAIYCFYARFILIIHIDDPVNAFPLHFGGGSWGTAAVALFAHPDRLPDFPNGGILYAWDRDSFKFLGIQLMGVAIVSCWVAVLSFILFVILRLLGILRAGKDEETDGLDFVNGEPAYPIDAALLAFGKNSEDDDIDDEDDPPE